MVTEEQVKNIPVSPGVYLMKDGQGKVIYIGKAVNLRNRVRSYFKESADSRYTIKFIMFKVEDIECLVTSTENEALILEDNLIKKYKPCYNIRLKDDKTYYSLKIDINHPFPRLSLVRKVKKDDALYFGPFASSAAVKATIKMIRRLFPIRSCSNTNFMNKSRPCLDHQMQRCSAPCCGYISAEKYGKMIHAVVLLLQGRDRTLLQELRAQMDRTSSELRYEAAADVRDKIRAIEETLEEQKVVVQSHVDQDILSFYREGDSVAVVVLYIRGGKLLGSHSFFFRGNRLPTDKILSSFMTQYYQGDKFIPQEILIPVEVEDKELLQKWLREKKGDAVKLLMPRRGERARLITMASRNAKVSFKKRQEDRKENLCLIEEMKAALHLKKMPYRIECFDVSNIQGKTAVASMVVFENGKAVPSRYRKYRVKTLSRPDDYGMLHEILIRRYTRAVQENDIPDLVMVDGGKGQLNVAFSVLKEMGIETSVDAVSLAKDRRTVRQTEKQKHRAGDREKVYIPCRKNPVALKSHPQVLFLLQRIRDEAHRCAIGFHKKRRKKELMHSRLEDVPGVGPMLRKRLWKKFSSLEAMRDASLEELCNVQGITTALAERIHRTLTENGKNAEPLDADQRRF